MYMHAALLCVGHLQRLNLINESHCPFLLAADERMIVGDKCSDEACLPLSDAPSNTDDVRGHQRGYHPGSELPDATVAASGQEKAEGGGAKSSSGSLAAKSSGSGNKAAEVMRQEGDSNRLA